MTAAKLHGADLHLHTIYSDGAYTPESLVAAAQASALRTLATTDHDSVDAVAPTRLAAQPAGIEVIAGVEFATPLTASGEEDVHIVGLFLDIERAELLDALRRNRELRKQRVLEMIEKLNRIGIALRWEEVLPPGESASLTRLHVARSLVQAGHASSIKAAFKRWLRPGGPAFVPHACPTAAETMALIHRVGGVALMAHPGRTGRDAEIPSLAAAGLDALEIYCPDHPASEELRYLELAGRHGLLAGGGSDCHGNPNGRILIGKARVDEARVEALRTRAAQHAAAAKKETPPQTGAR
jgi:hypothetical protein